MSLNTSTHTDPPVIPSEAEINALMEQFESLAERAKFLIFQDMKILKWFASPIRVAAFWQKVIMSWTNPWPSFLLPGAGLSLIILFFALSRSTSSQNDIELEFLPTLLFIALLLLSLFLLFLAYGRWYIFWRYDERLFIGWKIILLLFAVESSMLFTLEEIYPALESLNSFVYTTIGFTALVTFPIFTFLWIFLFSILTWGIRTILAIISFHNPTWQKAILRLLNEPIPLTHPNDQDRSEVWWLSALEPRKFRLLQEWSKLNRDHTEKRLIPTSVFLAVLGVVIEASTGVDTYSAAIRDFYSIFAPLLDQNIEAAVFLPRYFLFIISVFPFVLIIMLLADLFLNLAVRSLIVEACEWAIYFRPEQQLLNPISSPNGTRTRRGERRGCLLWPLGR